MAKEAALVPSDAIRLAALGSLALGPKTHARLAEEILQLSSRIVGPSLDLMAPSLELLGVEELRVTGEGRTELQRLLTAPLRGPIGEVNKLFIALKMRFLHLVGREERLAQTALLIRACEEERDRIAELRRQFDREPGHLPDWLAFDLAEVEGRLVWFRQLQAQLRDGRAASARDMFSDR